MEQELLEKIKRLESELAIETQSRKNAAAMAERQKRRVQKLETIISANAEMRVELMQAINKMAAELQTLKPGWAFQH